MSVHFLFNRREKEKREGESQMSEVSDKATKGAGLKELEDE